MLVKRPTKKWLKGRLVNKAYTDIALELGVHKNSITRYVRFYGLQGTRLNKIYSKTFLSAWFNSGKSMREFCRVNGTGFDGLRNKMKEFNIIIPKIGKRECTDTRKEYRAILNGQITHWKKWRNFRLEILTRDKFQCKICDKLAHEIHHKKLRRIFPHLCWVKSNVISVCKKCHIKLDIPNSKRWIKC